MQTKSENKSGPTQTSLAVPIENANQEEPHDFNDIDREFRKRDPIQR
jgi:hypothetical protein